MGYYTYMAIEAEFKDEASKQRMIDEKDQYLDGSTAYVWEKLEVSPRGYPEFNDGECKGWDFEENAKILSWFAQLVTKDSYIEGNGEDSDDRWRIVFDGQGSYKLEYARTFYGDIWEHILEEYKDIPEELRDLIHKYYIATKV